VGYTFGVGRAAPGFTLPARGGGEISLSDYRGDWSPILVFFRHDDPGSQRRLSALSAAADAFWGVRGQLLAITAIDAVDVVGPEEQTDPLAFAILIDAGGAVARSYGAWDDAQRAVVPTVFIVDRVGKVVWAGHGAADTSPAALMRVFRDVVR
jgi:peroxiredoxin